MLDVGDAVAVAFTTEVTTVVDVRDTVDVDGAGRPRKDELGSVEIPNVGAVSSGSPTSTVD